MFIVSRSWEGNGCQKARGNKGFQVQPMCKFWQNIGENCQGSGNSVRGR